jgi:hypothetical protein
MLEKIKDKLNDVIAIADRCPEKYQVKCFEILLGALVTAESGVPVAGAAITTEQVVGKPRHDFFTRQNIAEKEWQQVFHFDGTSYSIIVSDLKERPVSKKQVRLALLLGIKGLLETGAPTIEKGQLIELCKQHAAYDSANFSAHMKNQKNLFLPKGNNWVLTKPGESQAAEVIKELSQ